MDINQAISIQCAQTRRCLDQTSSELRAAKTSASAEAKDLVNKVNAAITNLDRDLLALKAQADKDARLLTIKNITHP